MVTPVSPIDPYTNASGGAASFDATPPTPGAPTKDPNLVSMFVPSENTSLDYGSGDPPGVRVATDNHVHFTARTPLTTISLDGATLVLPPAMLDDAKAFVADIIALSRGASPQVSAGFAGPKDIVAPPRFGKGPWGAAPSPEAMAILEKELGPQAALAGPAGAELRKLIKGAAFAGQEERWADAAHLQGQAIGRCEKARLTDLGCVLQTSLGGYLLQADLRPRARATFEVAAANAKGIGRPDLQAQALLGLAASLVLDKEWLPAIGAYRRAGEASEEAKLAILAIEAYRTAGQVALRAGAEQAAAAAWKCALGVAAAGDAKEIAASSAPVAARALAKVLQGHGSDAAAAALLADADRMERGGAEGGADVRG